MLDTRRTGRLSNLGRQRLLDRIAKIEVELRCLTPAVVLLNITYVTEMARVSKNTTVSLIWFSSPLV